MEIKAFYYSKTLKREYLVFCLPLLFFWGRCKIDVVYFFCLNLNLIVLRRFRRYSVCRTVLWKDAQWTRYCCSQQGTGRFPCLLNIFEVVCQEHGMKLVHLSTAVNEIQYNKYWMSIPRSHRWEVIQVSLEAMAAMYTMSRESGLLGGAFDPFQLCFKTLTRVMENVSKMFLNICSNNAW